MNDFISRQAAIDAAVGAVDEWDGGSNEHRHDMIASAINALPPAQQWIPVTQSLPTQYGSYLVSMRDDAFVYWQVCISTFNQKDKKWSFYDNSFGMKVTAWMPMPEPYKEEKG